MDEMNELPRDLRAALDELGRRAAVSARRVDHTRVSTRLLERLRSEPGAERPSWGMSRRALRVAAALALLVAGGLVARLALDGRESPVVPLAVTTLADSLNVHQAESLLATVESFEVIATTVPAIQPVSAEDLTEDELRALLQAMQSETEGEL